MDFVGRKQNCERETRLENSENELVSEQADSECNASLLDEQKGTLPKTSGLSPLVDLIRKLSKKSISNEALSMDLSTGALKQRMPVNRQIEYEPRTTDINQPMQFCNDQPNGWHYVSHE